MHLILETLRYVLLFQCAKTFLSLMGHISKDQTVQYILTMIDDMLQVSHMAIWWHHHMEMLFALLAICEGNPWVTIKDPCCWPICEGNPLVIIKDPSHWLFVRESTGHRWIPSQRASDVTWFFNVKLMLSWTSCWTNNQVASDLWWHDTHVTSHVKT